MTYFYLLWIVTTSDGSFIWFVNWFPKFLCSDLKWKRLCIFVTYNSFNRTKTSFFFIISKEQNISWFDFFDSWSMMIHLIYKQILSLKTEDISFWCLFTRFDWLLCADAKTFFANSQVISIFPEMCKIF